MLHVKYSFCDLSLHFSEVTVWSKLTENTVWEREVNIQHLQSLLVVYLMLYFNDLCKKKKTKQ